MGKLAKVAPRGKSCRCKAEKLIMVGDRYLTDIVYGNQNGLLTIRPAPLTMKGDPSVVRMVRAPEPDTWKADYRTVQSRCRELAKCCPVD